MFSKPYTHWFRNSRNLQQINLIRYLLYMTQERSSGVIVFTLFQKEPYVLLLHYPASSGDKESYWDLPKGHLEKGETDRQTAVREVKEETGIDDLKFFEGFKEQIHYWFQVQKTKVSKTVVFYLACTKKHQIKVSFEHTGYVWLPFNDAIAAVKFQNAKDVLSMAKKFLALHRIATNKRPVYHRSKAKHQKPSESSVKTVPKQRQPKTRSS